MLMSDGPQPGTAKELWYLLHGVESDSRSFVNLRNDMWNSSKFDFPRVRVKNFHYGDFNFWRVLKEEDRRNYSNLVAYYLMSELHYYPNVQSVNIICHSFGTYLFTRALQEHTRLQADNIILLGSVVNESFPWNSLYEDGKFNNMVNFVGSSDWVQLFAKFFVDDFGNSGSYGFKEGANGRASNLMTDWGHTSYSSKKNRTKILKTIDELR